MLLNSVLPRTLLACLFPRWTHTNNKTWHLLVFFIAICLLSNNINDYNIVAQGKTSIPGVDDGEEMNLTDVSPEYDYWIFSHLFNAIIFISIIYLFSSCLLAYIRLGQPQPTHVYVRYFGVCRGNDAKQPHLGLSSHKSGENADTWSQRRARVRSDGRKSRTYARSVRPSSDIRVLALLLQNFWHAFYLAPCKSSSERYAQVWPHEYGELSPLQHEHPCTHCVHRHYTTRHDTVGYRL